MGCCDTQDRSHFDPLRLEKAFTVLKNIGGIPFDVFSKDGTKLDAMILRYNNIKKAIQEHGGEIRDCLPVSIDTVTHKGKETTTFCHYETSHPTTYVDVILPKKQGPIWEEFYKHTLSHLGLEKVEIHMSEGYVVKGCILKYWKEKSPIRPK